MSATPLPSTVPPVAGIGLRAPHVTEVLERRPAAGWFEVHAENYMHDGAATARLHGIREHYPLSVHGVGLSLGSASGIDDVHLARLKAVVDRFEPALVSEHLAWTIAGGVYLNDLLPVPHDEQALAIVAANIARTQDTLRRRILVENLSTYVDYRQSVMSEPEFLAELVRRTGCGLLLDVNNVYVSASNIGFDARAYIAALPGDAIGEIHLAGHARNDTAHGPVLIDSHDARVAPDVWALYAFAIRHLGRRPTLIEWDADIPPFGTLMGEAMWADLLAAAIAGGDAAAARSPATRQLRREPQPVTEPRPTQPPRPMPVGRAAHAGDRHA